MKGMLWAGVAFTAQGGRIETLLQRAAEQHLRLRRITPCPGGFSAACSARRYPALARIARRCRVRLRIRRRAGLYFRLRPLLRRLGLWLGLAVFGAVLLLSRRMIWSMEYVGLTQSVQARAAATLRACGIREGVCVDDALLTLGETALVEQDPDIGWASLNFAGGRLTVETAPAAPVPAIRETRYSDLTARVSGMVLSMDVQAGYPAVEAGQTVEAGQVLIAASKLDRQGRPVTGSAAGSVTARFQWTFSSEQPLYCEAAQPDGGVRSIWRLTAAGRTWQWQGADGEAPAAIQTHTHHYGLTVLGLPLPVAVEETVLVSGSVRTVRLSERLALDRLRLAAARALAQEWPDAVTETVQEQTELRDDTLFYRLQLQIAADICQ